MRNDRFKLSVDEWAVGLALLLAVSIRFSIVPKIPS